MKNSGNWEWEKGPSLYKTITSPHHAMPLTCHLQSALLLRGNRMMGVTRRRNLRSVCGCCGHNACDCMISLVCCGTIHGTITNLNIWVCGGSPVETRLFAILPCKGRSCQPIFSCGVFSMGHF